jgi:hypothetical protein
MLNQPAEQAAHTGRSGPRRPVMVNNPASALTSGVAAGVPVIPATDYSDAIGDSEETAR